MKAFLPMLLFGLFGCFPCGLQAQEDIISYTYAREYQIAGIAVSGVSYLDNNAIVGMSGLAVGQRIRIPGDATAQALDKLWKYNLFEDIALYATKIEGDRIYLEIKLSERLRLSSIDYTGVPKSVVNKVKESMDLKPGDIITDYKIGNLEKKVKQEMLAKAYLNADVNVVKKADTAGSGIVLQV
ncbi:MAG: hypothetical protein K2M92_03245, partial [Bacteroidales bacterium]|nr:hypothetical protein [Bacteroidales bacterium]